MKKFFKGLGLVLFLLTIILAVGAMVIYSKTNSRFTRKFQAPLRQLPLVSAARDLEEGKRLFVSRGCPDCHGADLGGKTFIDDPAIGVVSGSNLTSGKGGIAAERSDSELARAIRNGVGKDGRGLLLMPAEDYAGMSDADTGKLIAYIRSASPVDRSMPEISIGPVARILFLTGKFPNLLAAEHIRHDQAPPKQVTAAVSVEFGRYVASTCTGCHGQNFAGGPIPGAPPEWLPASDIRKAALSSWTEADFIRALRTGRKPDGGAMRFPMPWQSLGRLTDTELKALWLYIQSK